MDPDDEMLLISPPNPDDCRDAEGSQGADWGDDEMLPISPPNPHAHPDDEDFLPFTPDEDTLANFSSRDLFPMFPSDDELRHIRQGLDARFNGMGPPHALDDADLDHAVSDLDNVSPDWDRDSDDDLVQHIPTHGPDHVPWVPTFDDIPRCIKAFQNLSRYDKEYLLVSMVDDHEIWNRDDSKDMSHKELCDLWLECSGLHSHDDLPCRKYSELKTWAKCAYQERDKPLHKHLPRLKFDVFGEIIEC